MATESKDFKVSLSKRDSEKLEQMAKTLGTTKSELFRKALKLMSLYTDAGEEGDVSIRVKKSDGEESFTHII